MKKMTKLGRENMEKIGTFMHSWWKCKVVVEVENTVKIS